MRQLPLIDLAVMVVYLAAIVGIGFWLAFKSPFHTFLIVVVSTLVIFFVGLIVSRWAMRTLEI